MEKKIFCTILKFGLEPALKYPFIRIAISSKIYPVKTSTTMVITLDTEALAGLQFGTSG